MHYKNGREAKVGDKVVTKDYNGNPFAGIVVNTIPGATACNLHVMPITPFHTHTAGECLHIDDAMADHLEPIADEKAIREG